MHKIKLIASAAAIAALVGAAGVANAQARRPAAPAATAPAPVPAGAAFTAGPPVPNVCIFSNQAAIGGSAVGKYVVGRLQQIQAQVQAELQSEDTSIQTDAKAYGAQRATLSADVQQQRDKGFSDRVQALQAKAQLRQRELEATQQKALSRVVSEFNPILQQVIKTRNCGLVIDGQSLIYGNPAMDLTPDVVRQLDAKITQFPFEREHLDTAAATPAAGAQR